MLRSPLQSVAEELFQNTYCRIDGLSHDLYRCWLLVNGGVAAQPYFLQGGCRFIAEKAAANDLSFSRRHAHLGVYPISERIAERDVQHGAGIGLPVRRRIQRRSTGPNARGIPRHAATSPLLLLPIQFPGSVQREPEARPQCVPPLPRVPAHARYTAERVGWIVEALNGSEPERGHSCVGQRG